MAFIVKKEINGKDYYYLNENKRIDGKVKTKTIAYLGKTKKDAEKKMKKFLQKKDVTVKKETERIQEVKEINIEEMTTFCKKKGFVYPSSEIYGGFAGFWDYGSLGTELNNNIKKEWWNFHVWQRKDVVGIDGSIITNPKVWEASGHVGSFSDVLAFCKKCKKPNKFDKFELDKARCQFCKGEIDKEHAQNLSMMMETNVGPDSNNRVLSYLRPETAQLIFSNFKNIVENSRLKLPFGIAQIGKAFRNEIAPRDFLFRAREFEQMELEYFINPNKKCPYEIPNVEILIYSSEMQEKNLEPKKMSMKEAFRKKIIRTDWHAYWLAQEFLFFTNLDANPEKFRIRQHISDEKSHYALDTWDFEYKFPFGWKELHGMANRGDYDLKQHEKFSGKDLKIFDEETKQKILPHVICEPSQGVGRAFLVFMFDAYFYDEKRQNVVLKLHPKLSPIKAAIFPLVKDKKMIKISQEIFDDLKKEFKIIYDESGSVGRRYSRNDEIGTPFCITVDDISLKNKDVTVRDRNTMKQIRVKISDLKDILRQLINQEILFEKAGVLIK